MCVLSALLGELSLLKKGGGGLGFCIALGPEPLFLQEYAQ